MPSSSIKTTEGKHRLFVQLGIEESGSTSQHDEPSDGLRKDSQVNSTWSATCGHSMPMCTHRNSSSRSSIWSESKFSTSLQKKQEARNSHNSVTCFDFMQKDCVTFVACSAILVHQRPVPKWWWLEEFAKNVKTIGTCRSRGETCLSCHQQLISKGTIVSKFCLVGLKFPTAMFHQSNCVCMLQIKNS